MKMNNNFIIVSVTMLALILAVVAASLYVGNGTQKSEKVKSTGLVTKLIDIDGMTCEECEITIKAAGEKIHGITKISASSSHKQAIVEFDSAITDIETIMKDIRETGYRPVSSKDVSSDYTFESIKTEAPKAAPAMKCGAGKCGANMSK